MGGLIVFNHICSCNNETTISLFVERNCCNAKAEALTCNMNGGACDAYHCDDCVCETEVEVFVTDYTIASEIKTNAVARFILHAIINSRINFELPKEFETSFTQEFNENVPPKAGKYLYILYQSLKIPFPNS